VASSASFYFLYSPIIILWPNLHALKMKITQALFPAALLAAAGAFPLANQARDLPPDAYVPNAYQMASGQGSAQFDGPYVTAPSNVSSNLLLLGDVTDRFI
jgi:hypothetical protein